MTLTWNHESPARWDGPKRRIIGGAPAGIFDSRFAELGDDAPLPGDWWRIDRDGVPVGYAWLDAVWGDAEITVAIDEAARHAGAGTFALDRLEKEARRRGLNRLYNIVRPTHPEHDATLAWFAKRGFQKSEDGSLMRAVPAHA
jgi:N-acetylglutamate synthase-like GNAT family acetyltransferase